MPRQSLSNIAPGTFVWWSSNKALAMYGHDLVPVLYGVVELVAGPAARVFFEDGTERWVSLSSLEAL